MELITILNRCHRFRGFVYERAHFSADKKSIEVAVRPRKGSTAVCSRCHLPAPGYNQLAERRFEFIPLWGGSSFAIFAVRRAALYAVAKRLSADTPASDASAKSRTMTACSFSSSFFDVLCR